MAKFGPEALKQYAAKDKAKDGGDDKLPKGFKPRGPQGAKTPPHPKSHDDDDDGDDKGDDKGDGDPEWSDEMHAFFDAFPEKFQDQLKGHLDKVAKAIKGGDGEDAVNELLDYLAGHAQNEKKDAAEAGHEGSDEDEDEDTDA